MFVIKEENGFQASLSYRRPHFGLLDDILKVAYGNNTCFEEYQITFCPALSFWFLKSLIDRVLQKKLTLGKTTEVCYCIVI